MEEVAARSRQVAKELEQARQEATDRRERRSSLMGLAVFSAFLLCLGGIFMASLLGPLLFSHSTGSLAKVAIGLVFLAFSGVLLSNIIWALRNLPSK